MSRMKAILFLLLAGLFAAALPVRAGEDNAPIFVAPEKATDEDLSPLVRDKKKSTESKKTEKRVDEKKPAPEAKPATVESKPVEVEKPAPVATPEVKKPEPKPQPPAVAVPEEKKPVEVKPAPVETPAPKPVATPAPVEPEKKPIVETKPVPAEPRPVTPAPVAKPEPAPVAAPEVKKPAPVAEPKPEVAVEKKPEPKPEPKPEVAAEKKPEPRPEVAAEKKPEPKPEVAAEKKPEPKAETPKVTAAEKKPETPTEPAKAAPNEKDVTTTVSAADIAPPLPESEQKLLDMINQAFAAQGRAYFKGRRTQRIYAGQAVLKGIDKNLAIQRQEKQEDIAKAARMEARAIFDPVFTVSFNHQMFQQNNRLEQVIKFQRAAVPDLRPELSGATVDPTQPPFVEDIADLSTPKIPIKEILFDKPINPGFKKLVTIERAIASEENINGPSQTEAPSFSIQQQLPWGPVIFMTMSSKKNESFFDDGPDPILDLKLQQAKQRKEDAIRNDPTLNPTQKATALRALAFDPEILALKQAFDRSARKGTTTSRPWSTSFTGGVTTPVPFTKDWGGYADGSLSIKLADLDKERAYWDTKTVVNNTLAQIDFAYWDLVGAMESLRAVVENRKLLEVLHGDIKKQLDAGRTTQYGILQIDSQLANVKGQEEAAWTSFIQASNALTFLLDDDKQAVFLPAGWTKALGEQIKWKPEDAFKIAEENRPELKAQKIGGQTSEVLLRFAKTQVKPDLKYGLSFTVSQNNKPFGFKTWSQSIDSFFGGGKDGKHIVEVPVKGVGTPANLSQVKQAFKADDTNGPDNRIHSHTLAYNWPFKNRAVKANLKEAEFSRGQQDDIINLTENGVEQDVGNAVVNLLAAKEQSDIANDAFKLSTAAYDDANKLMGAGRITEFEIISRTQDLLFSDLSRIAATIFYKKSETELLRAEGILPNVYPGLHSMGGMDEVRLKLMSTRRAMKFFQPLNIETEAAQPEADASKTADAAKDNVADAKNAPVAAPAPAPAPSNGN